MCHHHGQTGYPAKGKIIGKLKYIDADIHKNHGNRYQDIFFYHLPAFILHINLLVRAACHDYGISESLTQLSQKEKPECINHSSFSLISGSNGARTHDLSRVRRTLIPAELCFQTGDSETRTRDLYVANVSLSQLSYIPLPKIIARRK